jgi:hypothetical protein
VSLFISKQGRGCAKASPQELNCNNELNSVMIDKLFYVIHVILSFFVSNLCHSCVKCISKCSSLIALPLGYMLILNLMALPTKGKSIGDVFSTNQLTQILSSEDEHYLVFDQVGLMASTTTYMHVMLPLNFSSVELLIKTMNSTLHDKIRTTDFYKDLRYYEKMALERQTTSNIAALTRRLNIAFDKLQNLNRILPKVEQNQHRFKKDTSSELPPPLKQNHDDFLPLDHPHLTRHKRWLLPLLQGVVGTFMGLYTNYQIKTIANKVHNIEITQNLLIHLTRQHTLQLEKLSNMTGTIYHTLHNYININPQIIYIEFNEVVSLIEGRVTQLVNVVQQLQHRRLAVDFLTQQQLEALHKTVIAYTTERNYALLTTHPSDYFQLELSYLKNEDGVLALLHVPCTTSPDLMTIMRYIPFPIPLETPTHHSPYSVEQSFLTHPTVLQHSLNNTLAKNEALYLIAEADLIAIDGDSRFRLLTQSDFAACIQRNHIYLCDKQQILGTNLLSTCLGSLYHKDPEGVRTNCRFERRPLREEVFQMAVNEFLVFSPHPYVSRVHCNNGTSFTADFGQTTRLIIPNGCSIELKSHVLRVEENIQVPLPASISSWRWDPLSLPADLLDNLPHLDSALSNISRTLSSIQTDNTTMDKIHALTNRLATIQNMTYPDFVSETIDYHMASSGSKMSIILWFGFVVSILAFLAALVFTYRQIIMSRLLKSYSAFQLAWPHILPEVPTHPIPQPTEVELETRAPMLFAKPPQPQPQPLPRR